MIDNDSSTYGWPGGVERRFEIEGWTSSRVQSVDHDGLEGAFRAAPGGPNVVVVETGGKRSSWRQVVAGARSDISTSQKASGR